MIVKHSSDETPKPMPVGLRLARVVSIGNGTVDVCPIGSSVVLHDIPVTSATTMQTGDVINLQMMDNKRFAFAQQNVTSASEPAERTVTIVNATVEGGGGGGGSSGTLSAGSGISVNPTGTGNLGGNLSVAVDASVARNTWVVAAGNGLTGGGQLSSAGITLNVGAGDGIAVNNDSIAVNNSVVRTSRNIFAGNGLTGTSTLASDVTLNVGAGDGIAVDADSIRVRRATTSGLSFSSGGLQIDDTIAGNGLTIASKVLAIGAGNGISVASTSVAVNQAYAFTWSAAHTFSASATFSAGLTATRLTGSSNVLELANATSFQSESFNSGFAGDGWRITRPSGASAKASFETDNLTVRGSLRVYELLINQVRATNGSVLVSSTGKVATATYVSGTGGANGVTYNFATDADTNHGFAANDIIMAKRFTGSGVFTLIMRVASSPAPTATTWRGVQLYADGDSPTTSTGHVGLEFVRIGNTTNADRRGSVYLSADDSGAPFIQIIDGVAAAGDWNAAGKMRARFGNLNGSYGYSANTYGFAAGDSSTTFVSADATNGFRVRTGSANRFSVDTSGNVALRDGNNVQRIGLTSAGVVEIDDSDGNARVLIDSGGLKLRDSSGNAAITLDASGNSQFTGVMTIGTSGEIRQGTGSLTAPATYTGLRMWRDGNIGRIAGYNSGTAQWYAGTDGKLYAGGGNVIIDSKGITVFPVSVSDPFSSRISFANSINWFDSGDSFGYEWAKIAGYKSNSGNYYGGLAFYVRKGGDVLSPTIVCDPNKTGYNTTLYGNSEISTGSLSIDIGLNVGNVSNAGIGEIKLSGILEAQKTQLLRYKYGPSGFDDANTQPYLQYTVTTTSGGFPMGAFFIYLAGRQDGGLVTQELWYFQVHRGYQSTYSWTSQRIAGGSDRVVVREITNTAGFSTAYSGTLTVRWWIGGNSSGFNDGLEVTVMEIGAGMSANHYGTFSVSTGAVSGTEKTYGSVKSGDVIADRFVVDADAGAGIASTVSLTNSTTAITNDNNRSLYMRGTTGTSSDTRRNAGLLKMYVGTTAVYVPYWDQP